METGKAGIINTVIREIPVLGYERFWNLVSGDEEVDVTDLNFSKNAQKRFTAGVIELRKRLDLPKKQDNSNALALILFEIVPLLTIKLA